MGPRRPKPRHAPLLISSVYLDVHISTYESPRESRQGAHPSNKNFTVRSDFNGAGDSSTPPHRMFGPITWVATCQLVARWKSLDSPPLPLPSAKNIYLPHSSSSCAAIDIQMGGSAMPSLGRRGPVISVPGQARHYDVPVPGRATYVPHQGPNTGPQAYSGPGQPEIAWPSGHAWAV